LSIHGKSLWSKPNGGTSVPKIWKGNGYNPNNKTLPKFWSCPWFGHAKFLVGLVGAQTKHTQWLIDMWECHGELHDWVW
jgi:hypothetical protein